MIQKIPQENLGFVFGILVDRKDPFTERKVLGAPFNKIELKEALRESDGERRYLEKQSVEWLKSEKEIPEKTPVSNYHLLSGVTIIDYNTIERLKNAIDNKTGKSPILQSIKKKLSSRAKAKILGKIIISQDYKEQIIETIAQFKYSKKIFNDWGLQEKIKRGRGINILFTGKSGTGKTYCGEIIAEYLGLPCKIISVASLESKFVGESEQNVANMFKDLDGKHIIIIDEIDSFLSSRADSSHEHNYKLTNQFLMELERHNGICIMTTNRPIKLDKAVRRRIDLILEFKDPDFDERKKLWQYMIPKKLPKNKINYDKIAQYKINGGLIKNTVLRAVRKMVHRNIKKMNNSLLIESIKQELESNQSIEAGDFST